jgi:hypothetical protein
MTESLTQSPSAFGRWTGASVDALRSLWRRDETREPAATAVELLPGIEGAAEVGRRFAARIHGIEDSQPLANAASICRWELLVLRERVLELSAGPKLRGLQTEIVRHLDEAAAAARILSSGYRFHSLDRICAGGQALDDHLEALEHLRPRLLITH